MDRFQKAFNDMIRNGADPRRADPTRRLSPFVHVISSTPGWLLYLMGIGSTLIVVLGIATILDLRPARQDDVRLANIVRTAIANPEALAPSELAARLSLDSRQGQLIGSLLSANSIPIPGWLASITASTPLSVDPGRVQALGAILQRLSHLDNINRSSWLDRLLELDRIARNTDASSILRTVGDLPPEELHELVSSLTFRQVLDEIASLPEQKRNNLLIVGLDAIPEDRGRAHLLRALPLLDAPSVQILNRWLEANQGQRSALMFYLANLENRDVYFGRMLSAYYLRVPSLLGAVRALPPLCSFAEPRLCQ